MRIDVLTICPGMFKAVLGESIIKRAIRSGIVDIRLHNLRDFTKDRHRKVDDKPFGGGPGMVMMVQPIYDAVNSLRGTPAKRKKNTRVVLLTPQGKKLDQDLADKLSKHKHLVLICGHYEGVDERVRHIVTDEVSIGDYVLTGGELPAMVLIDTVVRLMPGALGDKDSTRFESFRDGLVEYPHYTRPRVFKKMAVPTVLLNGDHNKIEKWRSSQAIKRTKKRRPDLLKTQPKKRGEKNG